MANHRVGVHMKVLDALFKELFLALTKPATLQGSKAKSLPGSALTDKHLNPVAPGSFGAVQGLI